jgi:GTP pyrophosphokinase
MSPLHRELRSGDRVDIVRKSDQKPSRAWLDIAKTGRALSKIRRSVREKERDAGRELGKEMVEAELKKRGTTLSKVTKEGLLEQAAQQFSLHNVEQVFLAVGSGNLTMVKVMDELAPGTEPEAERPGWRSWFSRPKKRSISPVLIDGQSDLLVNFAKCCSPLPGEQVMGFITRGRGITVHLANCTQLMASDSERRIPVAWHQGASGAHTGEIRIVTANTPGMLAEVGGICKSLSINVTRLEAKEVDRGRAEFTLSVNVVDVEQLVRLMRNLEKIDGVLRVDRVRALRV